jgi:hypothetical protein
LSLPKIAGQFVRFYNVKVPLHFSVEIAKENNEAGTVYNFDTIDVDGKPEVQVKCLKRLVGERGFEPPTPWSRTRFKHLSKFRENSKIVDFK